METTITTLLDLMALHGGEIVSTASLNTYNIDQARASGRMYVREDSLGFVWIPKPDFPETVEEVEQFEKWFPLKAKLPESLKTPAFLFKKNAETEKGVELWKEAWEYGGTPETVEKKDEWKDGDQFTTPETGGQVFTVSKVTRYDVEAVDKRSRSGITVFSKSYITKLQSPAVSAPVEDLLVQVKDHIKSHKHFNWDEALTDNEMEMLEDLLLTFNPILPPRTVGNPSNENAHLKPLQEGQERAKDYAKGLLEWMADDRVADQVIKDYDEYLKHLNQQK
jgi:hypothetical protein